MTDEISIQKLKEKYGKILKLTSDDQLITVYCKKPTFDIYLEYQNKYKDNPHEAILFLFKECLIDKESYVEEFMLSAGNSIVATIKKDSEFTINATPQKDEFKKSAALIRYAFQVDPYKLPMDEFYKLLEEALWLQKHSDSRMENTMITAFAKTFSN
jgi:type IV secretory pathway ATPase VirB11/archaellum biosynthesis ATPase